MLTLLAELFCMHDMMMLGYGRIGCVPAGRGLNNNSKFDMVRHSLQQSNLQHNNLVYILMRSDPN